MVCAACSAEVPEDDLFCEACGARLHGAVAAAAGGCVCGETGVDADGFCEGCGRRVRRPAEDHIEIVVSADFAGVSDRGVKHDRNEDRLALGEAGGARVMVVCDGVSATRLSERASGAVAADVLAGLGGGGGEDAEETMRAALRGAAERLAAGTEKGRDAASTTVVAALVRDGVAVIGWAGDSRAYWVDAMGARQLTVDHSWLNDVVAAGTMTAEEARRDPRAHAITRWLGADWPGKDGEGAAGEVVRFALPGAGVLMLCSDGLWNYAEDMAAVMAGVGGDAPEMADALVGFANGAGGRDNVTVVILRVGAGSGAAESRAEEHGEDQGMGTA